MTVLYPSQSCKRCVIKVCTILLFLPQIQNEAFPVLYGDFGMVPLHCQCRTIAHICSSMVNFV